MKRFIILPLVIVLGVFVSFDGLRTAGPLAPQEEAGEETSRAEAIRANFDKLVSEDKEVKREALRYFGKVDKTFATEVPLFTSGLKDERTQVRAISAYALGKIGIAAVGSIPEVEKLLSDSSATVKKYAQRALERLQPLKPAQKPVPEETQAPRPTPGELIDKLRGLGWKVKTDKNGVVVGVVTATYLNAENIGNDRVSNIDLTLVHLQELPELQELRIEHSRITLDGLVHLKGLKKLRRLALNFSRLPVAGMGYLKGLTELEDLELLRNDDKITDAGLVHLKKMTKLKRLILSGNKLTNAGLAHLRGLVELETLYLDVARVTNAGLVYLKGMKNLKNLHLEIANQISNAGLKHLKGLTQLEQVIIWNSRITDSGVMWLKKAFPNSEIRVYGKGKNP